jgi:MFS family permease
MYGTLLNETIPKIVLMRLQQRGTRMALTNLAVFGGAFFTPILVGKITYTVGWPWSFYFITIFTGVCLPLVIFFVPETAFRRSAHLNTDLASMEDVQLYEKREEANLGPDNAAPVSNTGSDVPATEQNFAGYTSPKRSFGQSLLPFNGRVADDNFLKLILRPFPLFFQPAILWACLIQGCMIGWTVFIGIILAAVFIGPPNWWDEVRTGYAYTGAFLGAFIGFVIAGALADWSAKFMTRKNNGVYEPEFRIILVIPQLVFGCTGLYLFGVTAARMVDYSWVLPVFGFGLQVGGMVIGAVAASLYIVDAHRKLSSA